MPDADDSDKTVTRYFVERDVDAAPAGGAGPDNNDVSQERARSPRRFLLSATAVVLLILAAVFVASRDDDGGSQDRMAQRDDPLPQRPLPQGPSAKPTPATAEAKRVIEGWTAAVRAADFEKAAEFFAIPSIVANGGPPRKLDNPALVIAWNATLPCGAKVVRLTSAPQGFTVAVFELTDRKGSSCGSGTGAPAASAIKVKDGKITEWYRLADGAPPPGEPVRPEAPPGPGVET